MVNDKEYLDQLRQVLESAPTALLAVSPEGEIVFSNSLAEQYFGYTGDAMLSLSIDDLIPERYRHKHRGYFAAYFATLEPRSMGAGRELFGLRMDGTEFPVEIGLNPITANGRNLVVASIIDITDRKKSEERYKLAIQQSPVGVLIVSESGTIILSNQSLDGMFGYDPHELEGKLVEELVPLRVRGRHENYRRDFMASPSARQMGIGRDLYGIRKNGSEFPVEVGLNPLLTSEGTEIIVTVVDITNRLKLEHDKKEFEQKLQQTQKLESLGILAGGIAHDFNNLLTGIVGNVELAMMDTRGDSGIMRYLKRIQDASDQASELCDQMLAYSGTGRFVNEPFDINDVIESTYDLINVSVSKNATIKFALAEKLPQLKGDPTQIRQVIMNLIINASEAIGSTQGTIFISTGITDYDPATMAGNSPVEEEIPRGRYVHFSVNDTGHGMDKETQKKIFEPFFSTKFTGRGLGLAAVLGIVHHHKGTVRIYSEEGRGTSFKVLLPFESNEVLIDDELDKSNYIASGSILVIDDEELVHQVVGDSLERVGFNVIHARDGREGLQCYKENTKIIRLIILDLTMPYLPGDEVFRQIRKANDTVPVIITSGYSEESVVDQFFEGEINGFLSKPISPAKLLELVKTILEESED